MPIFPLFAFSFCVKNMSHMTSNNTRTWDLTWCCHRASVSVCCGRELPVHTFYPSPCAGPVYTVHMSSVLMVAAKFHRPTLNSTSVALCYLGVISHVRFWLTKKGGGSVCVCVCAWSKTLCKVKQKCEQWGWEEEILLVVHVVKFVIDATL